MTLGLVSYKQKSLGETALIFNIGIGVDSAGNEDQFTDGPQSLEVARIGTLAELAPDHPLWV
jgi:hypothetical protein